MFACRPRLIRRLLICSLLNLPYISNLNVQASIGYLISTVESSHNSKFLLQTPSNHVYPHRSSTRKTCLTRRVTCHTQALIASSIFSRRTGPPWQQATQPLPNTVFQNVSPQKSELKIFPENSKAAGCARFCYNTETNDSFTKNPSEPCTDYWHISIIFGHSVHQIRA